MAGLLKENNESTSALQFLFAFMEKETAILVKRGHGNNASELLSNCFPSWLREKGDAYETSHSYSPKSNGKGQRVQQTIMTMKSCLISMLKGTESHTALWEEAVVTANC